MSQEKEYSDQQLTLADERYTRIYAAKGLLGEKQDIKKLHDHVKAFLLDDKAINFFEASLNLLNKKEIEGFFYWGYKDQIKAFSEFANNDKAVKFYETHKPDKELLYYTGKHYEGDYGVMRQNLYEFLKNDKAVEFLAKNKSSINAEIAFSQGKENVCAESWEYWEEYRKRFIKFAENEKAASFYTRNSNALSMYTIYENEDTADNVKKFVEHPSLVEFFETHRDREDFRALKTEWSPGSVLIKRLLKNEKVFEKLSGIEKLAFLKNEPEFSKEIASFFDTSKAQPTIKQLNVIEANPKVVQL